MRGIGCFHNPLRIFIVYRRILCYIGFISSGKKKAGYVTTE